MVSKQRQTKDEVVEGLSDEESDNDSIVIKTSKKKTNRPSLDDSDKDMTYGETDDELPSTSVSKTPRSSGRLKAKSQREYVKPNRKETLNKISNGSEKCGKISLRPRNLTSDFVRGCSRYVTDRTATFESSGSDLSDFIDDSDEKTVKIAPKRQKKNREMVDVEQSDTSHDSKNCSKTSGWKRRKRKQTVESSGSSCDSDVKMGAGKRSKSKKSPVISDDDEKLSGTSKNEDGEYSGSHDVKKILSSGKQKKKQVAMELESDDENSLHNISRKLRGRTKSAQKEKKEELLAKITAKRNIAKLKSVKVYSKEVFTMVSGQVEQGQEMEDGSFSDDNYGNILDSSELEERDSDREFVVEDDFCDADSDGVTEFYKHVHSSQSVPVFGGNSLELPQKKLHNFQRIQILSESEDSDDNASSFSPNFMAISSAVKENDVNIVKTVIERNPDIIHEVGSKRQSLLHVAVIFGSLQVAQLLLDHGCDKLALDALFLPPVAYAMANGDTQCLKILLQDTDLTKVNKTLEDHHKCSLLHVGIYGSIVLPSLKRQAVNGISITDMLKMLFECDELLCLRLMEGKDSHSFTPLVAAIVAGHHQCVEYFVEQGASVKDFKSKNGGNLLHFAIECSTNLLEESEQNNSCCLQTLLSTRLKRDIDAVDNSDFSPLMCAAQSGNHDCVLALLESGASVHCKDKHDTTSLHLAAASGDTTCVKLLLAYGHKVDCLDSFGWPPLLYANFAAQESCVLSLMEPNPKQIFVLGDLLRRGKSKSAKERNFKVIRDVLVALANQDAYYRVFNDFLRLNPDILEEYDKGLLHQTWIAILDFSNKQMWFRRKLAVARSGYSESVSLKVNRDSIFNDAMHMLNRYSGSALRGCNLAVTFRNEPGICTGPKKEFFVNVCKDIVEPSHNLLYATDDNQYSLHPNAFFAEQTKKNGTTNKCPGSELMHQKGSVLSSGNVCEEENESEQYSVGNALNEPSRATLTEEDLDTNNRMSSLNGDFMDKDGDKAIAELDLEEVFSNGSLAISNFVDKMLAKHLDKLKFLGSFIGLAICQGHFLNLHLSKPLVKQILGIALSHPDDLSYLDYELHKNLVSFILENDHIDDEMLPCSLDVVNPWNDHLTTVNLFPENKKDEFLNNNNKVEYVELVSKYKLSVLIEKEVNALCQGLYEDTRIPVQDANWHKNGYERIKREMTVNSDGKNFNTNVLPVQASSSLNTIISKDLFSLFTADEFSLLINGVDKIDVADWRKNTVYSGVNTENREEVKWFWEIVNKLKEEEKALLLKFSTGSPCLPAGGFAELQGLGGATLFRITITCERNKIPTASTCFNNLKLTSYDTVKELKDKLLIAIRHGTEGFSFS